VLFPRFEYHMFYVLYPYVSYLLTLSGWGVQAILRFCLSTWKAVMLALLMWRIYELSSWDGLRFHGMNNKFHKYWFIISSTFLLGSIASLLSELMWNYGPYRQLLRSFDGWSTLSQGHYLHRTTQTKETRTDTHTWNGIQTHDPSVWATKIFYALDHETTVIGDLLHVQRILQDHGWSVAIESA
jgi:hypothetical protein